MLPTLWFRNTWSWDAGAPQPTLAATGRTASVAIDHPFLGELELLAGAGPDGASPTLLFCENETNDARGCSAPPPTTPYPKDGINDHVVNGAATVNPDRRRHQGGAAGTRLDGRAGRDRRAAAAAAPGRRRAATAAAALGADFDRGRWRSAAAEADEFYAELTPAGATADEALVMRQAFAGMLWSKQFYHYDVARWLDGDPASRRRRAARRHGRNAGWRHFDAADIMSMPDPWEYPWFAAWDLAFHCVALAHVDPAFAKYQLLLLCREWYQHPNGALPAYEWDVRRRQPAGARLGRAARCSRSTAAATSTSSSRVFHKLLINFTWWVNRKDAERQQPVRGRLPRAGQHRRRSTARTCRSAGTLEQSDATGWMAFYALTMLRDRARSSPVRTAADERPGAQVPRALRRHRRGDERAGPVGRDGRLLLRRARHARRHRACRCRSARWSASSRCSPPSVVDEAMLAARPRLSASSSPASSTQQASATGRSSASAACCAASRASGGCCSASSAPTGCEQLFAQAVRRGRVPLAVRAAGAVAPYHRDQPLRARRRRASRRRSTTSRPSRPPAMFGGNSNWRGPVWFPLNYLVVSALERYDRFFGDDFTIEYPTGSGTQLTLDEVADDLRRPARSRSSSSAPDGRRPCFGWVERLQHDPAWHDNLAVPRVLPRRQRRRARRLPPDRLDRRWSPT